MQGMTALMFAIEAKMEALCYKLIEMGADIHAKTVCPTPLLPSHLPQLRETHSDVMVWGATLGLDLRLFQLVSDPPSLFSIAQLRLCSLADEDLGCAGKDCLDVCNRGQNGSAYLQADRDGG